MELSEILSSVLLLLIGIVGFFVRKVLSDVEKLKKRDTQNQLTAQVVDSNKAAILKNETVMFKKFTSINAKNESQSELNSEFKALLASINTKLDILLKDHQWKHYDL